MKYGKIRIEGNSLIFVKRMISNVLPCSDILWAYRRVENGSELHSLVIHTRRGKKYCFAMKEDEARRCLRHLKECSPWMPQGFPKGARILLQNLPNTRDLGALRTADGRRILPHRLLRSGELYHMSQADVRMLKKDYGLTTVVDFRTDTERSQKPDTEIDGVCYIDNPILDEAAAGITHERDTIAQLLKMQTNGETYMMQMYRRLVLDDFSANQYAKFFQYLLEQEKGALLWHCTAGKDRAGIGTALVLSVLGVPKETIFEDYLRTGEYLKQEIEYLLQFLSAETPLDYAAEQNIRTLLGVEEEYLEEAFRAIDEQYGSMDRYLRKKICLTAKNIETLKNKYLV